MEDKNVLTEMVADIVSAYVLNNKVEPSALPDLIRTIYASLASAEAPAAPVIEEVAKPTAAQIRKSITPDALISFVDGKGYKTLKRHLTTHGLTFDAYREKFGLPRDYPTTAPNYSEQRSAMAKSIGLGARGRGGGAAKAPATGGRKPSASKA